MDRDWDPGNPVWEDLQHEKKMREFLNSDNEPTNKVVDETSPSVSEDAMEVPVKINDIVVGKAKIEPDGRFIAKIDANFPVAETIKNIFMVELTTDFSIGPAHVQAILKDKEKEFVFLGGISTTYECWSCALKWCGQALKDNMCVCCRNNHLS